ncbi:unnamed protein product [Oikopleura dioica]|uniref:Uncharacterized protein n=1 Tax=Oikopleura dioica TaxID=34765 RepID=E4XTX8_OIKDI|nr:unnamed protein product [Oikopleura dioica]CBY38769.1 unnamed protein product [Oikopleura dioica]
MSNFSFLKRKTSIFTLTAVFIYFFFNVFKIPCYTGTDHFGCPKYGIPAKFKELKTPLERHILRNYTCPVYGTDLMLVKTRKNMFDLHEGIFNFYTKRKSSEISPSLIWL